MKYAFFSDDCYNLYTITTNKFLSSKLEIVFVSDYSKEALTYLNLLRYVLLDSTKTIQSNLELLKSLEGLYNTKIEMTTTRVGKVLLTSLSAETMDLPLFSDEDFDKVVSILFEIINNPNISYNEFDEEIVKKYKRKVLNDITLVEDDKTSKMVMNTLKIVDNQIRGVNIYGDRNIINSITEKKLYSFYKEFLEESLKNIYYIGSKNEKLVKKMIQKYQNFNSIQTKKYSLFIDDYIHKLKLKNIKTNFEDREIGIIQLYSFNSLTEFERDYVVVLLNTILASASQDSLIFKKLRETYGLVYGLDTFYQKYDRIIILNTLCNEKEYKNVLKIIKSCIDTIKKGMFSDELFENSKKLLITSLNQIYDDKEKLIENLIFNTIFNVDLVDEKIDNIGKISKKDVINASKKMKLLVNYIGGE